jgi:prepilin-type N-terminal cleavage/methylation domain-containing protein
MKTGFTLIEVCICLLILSLGMMGWMSLDQKSRHIELQTQTQEKIVLQALVTQNKIDSAHNAPLPL